MARSQASEDGGSRGNGIEIDIVKEEMMTESRDWMPRRVLTSLRMSLIYSIIHLQPTVYQKQNKAFYIHMSFNVLTKTMSLFLFSLLLCERQASRG